MTVSVQNPLDPARAALAAGQHARAVDLARRAGETAFNEPDFDAFQPPNYRALRTSRWLYVEYVTGARELFDLRADPRETANIVRTASPDLVADLSSRLATLSTCTGPTCRVADTW